MQATYLQGHLAGPVYVMHQCNSVSRKAVGSRDVSEQRSCEESEWFQTLPRYTLKKKKKSWKPFGTVGSAFQQDVLNARFVWVKQSQKGDLIHFITALRVTLTKLAKLCKYRNHRRWLFTVGNHLRKCGLSALFNMTIIGVVCEKCFFQAMSTVNWLHFFPSVYLWLSFLTESCPSVHRCYQVDLYTLADSAEIAPFPSSMDREVPPSVCVWFFFLHKCHF